MILSPSILLVDDSRVSRMLAAGFIRERFPNASIQEAPDGMAALNLMMKETPDLAILDMNMPGLTGLEVAETALQDYPGIRLAILTANVQTSTREKAERLGIRFFGKPINEKVIGQILEILGEPA